MKCRKIIDKVARAEEERLEMAQEAFDAVVECNPDLQKLMEEQGVSKDLHDWKQAKSLDRCEDN